MEPTWLAGLQARAEQVLPHAVARYVACGAGEEVSRDEAVAAWAEHRLVPRVLRDVTDVDLTTDVLGRRAAAPWGWAPTSLQREVHPDGEVAVARASAAAGLVMTVSSNAGTDLAEIGATGVRWWLQVYLPQERSLALPLLERAVAAGAEALVLTLDTPVVGTKQWEGPSVWDVVDPRSVRVNFDPGYDDHPGSRKATDLGPADIAWLGERTGLPVVVKGLLDADDAAAGVDAGAAAVWVSNHGGRQLDRSVSTAWVLPRVAERVAGAVPVVVDGGLRSGLDVVTALALGADLTMLGRPLSWALVEGEPGIERLHHELEREVVEAFRLCGCRDLEAVRRLHVIRP